MRILAICFAVFVAGVSLVATLFPDALQGPVSSVPGGDLTGHFLLLGTTAFLATLAFAPRPPLGRRHLVAPLVVALVATADELLQQILPNRSFSLRDLAANYAGIAVFSMLALAVARRRGRRGSA